MGLTDKYRLEGKIPVQVVSWEEWGQAFEFSNRVVAKTYVRSKTGDREVSTVFLAMDHGIPGIDPRPVLFETMIFGGPDHEDQYQERYCLYPEAELGHLEQVWRIRGQDEASDCV
jgi:hypothetical protein